MSDVSKSWQNGQYERKVLIAGWFSFEGGHATAGDLLAMDVTCDWLKKAGYVSYDIAFDPPFKGGINWRYADPLTYSHVVFVCGPFQQNLYEAQFLTKFQSCRLIGLNLSMLVPLNQWNPFDLLYERNSTEDVRPDMVFLSKKPKVPVVGICLVESYPGALDAKANIAIQRLISSKEIGVVYIDTRLDINGTHLRTPAEIESLIARVDVLVTTRLHGAVMAIKNGVPVVPIDPEAGGAKIVLQLKKIGWPIVFAADNLDDEKLAKAFDYCLTTEAREKTKECCRYAITALTETQNDFIGELNKPGILEERFVTRTSDMKVPDWAIKKLNGSSTVKSPSNKLKKIVKSLGYWILPQGIFHAIKKIITRKLHLLL